MLVAVLVAVIVLLVPTHLDIQKLVAEHGHRGAGGESSRESENVVLELNALRVARPQRHLFVNLENDVVDAKTVGDEVFIDLRGEELRELRGSCSERFVSRASASALAPSAPMLLL